MASLDHMLSLCGAGPSTQDLVRHIRQTLATEPQFQTLLNYYFLLLLIASDRVCLSLWLFETGFLFVTLAVLELAL